jgi:hypothetical protein
MRRMVLRMIGKPGLSIMYRQRLLDTDYRSDCLHSCQLRARISGYLKKKYEDIKIKL